MFQKLKRIFGVGDDITASGRQASRLQAFDELPMFQPEHKLTSAEIEGGVGPNGECWEPWRTEHNSGLRWFKRISAAELQPVAPMVHGFSEVENHEFTGDEFDALHCDVPGTGGRVADGFEDCDYEARGT